MVQRYINLLKILGNNRSTFLFGARGTGKTALLKEFFLNAGVAGQIFNLLHSDTYRRYKLNTAQFRHDIKKNITSKKVTTIAVDEVQKIPELLDEVHALIEDHKRSLRFILTGSSARRLKRGGANLLAGRALTTKLHPLSTLELELDLERALSLGTLPGIYLDEEDVAPLLSAYVDTYVREEILQEAIIRREEPFLRFLDISAQANAEPITFSKIAKAAGVSPHTVESYYQILEDTLLGKMIPAYHASVRKQLTQSPRFYFFDCGVLNQLRGELKTELRESSYRYGKLFETFVVNELLRGNDYLSLGYKLYHWRTSSGREVDLILVRGESNPPIAIEVKSDTAPSKSDLSGLVAFKEEYPSSRCFVICRTQHPYHLEEIEVVPWQNCIRTIF